MRILLIDYHPFYRRDSFSVFSLLFVIDGLAPSNDKSVDRRVRALEIVRVGQTERLSCRVWV